MEDRLDKALEYASKDTDDREAVKRSLAEFVGFNQYLYLLERNDNFLSGTHDEFMLKVKSLCNSYGIDVRKSYFLGLGT